MTTTPNIIITSVKTEQQAAHLQLLFADVINAQYTPKESIQTIKSEYPPDIFFVFETLCEDNHISLNNTADLAAFAKRAKEYLSKLPVIHCTLAFSPLSSMTNGIYAKIAAIMQQPFLLSLTTDATLIGGMHIAINGKFFDYSLRQSTEKAVQKFA